MSPRPVPTLAHYCMDARAGPQHHAAVRVLTHIKKLYDCLGQFLVRMICDVARAERSSPRSWRSGWSLTLKELAPRMRCSRCGKKAAEVVAVARPRPRGVPEEPAL